MGVERLLKDISKSFREWDERSSFRLKGIGNLSVSDMDSIELYAKNYAIHGEFKGLMKPRGDIKAVLDVYGIKDTSFSLWD